MSTSTNAKVLVMGVKLGKSDSSPEQSNAIFGPQIEAAAKAGFDLVIHSVDVEEQVEVSVEEARAMLKQAKWDGVGIGFGLRGTEKFTPLFEKLMNAVVQEVQPAPRLCFPLRPHTVWEAVCRVYDVSQ